MALVIEFLKKNKQDIFYTLLIYSFLILMLGAKQKLISSGLFWLSSVLGIFLALIFGFLISVFLGYND